MPDGTDPGGVLERLVALGATGIEERDGTFVTFLRPPGEGADSGAVEARVTEIREALDRETGGRGSVDVEWGWQPHEEWSETWRRGLSPRRVGRRLVVSPTWTEANVGPDDLLVRIDPGMAFGTAEHETTRGCLRLLEEVVGTGDRIVDVGAGTGILSIAAALLGAEEAVAVESDDFAVEAARENVELNGVGERIRILHRSLDAAGLADLGPVDGVLANIQCRILEVLLPGARRALRSGGWMILGGVLAEERTRLLARAAEMGLEPEREILDGEWWSGRLRTPGGP